MYRKVAIWTKLYNRIGYRFTGFQNISKFYIGSSLNHLLHVYTGTHTWTHLYGWGILCTAIFLSSTDRILWLPYATQHSDEPQKSNCILTVYITVHSVHKFVASRHVWIQLKKISPLLPLPPPPLTCVPDYLNSTRTTPSCRPSCWRGPKGPRGAEAERDPAEGGR